MSPMLFSRHLLRRAAAGITPSYLSSPSSSSISSAVGPSRLNTILFRRTLLLQAESTEAIKLKNLSGDDSGVVELTIDRPERKNAIAPETIRGMLHALRKLREDESARLVLVMSNVPGIFCAGADLKERRKMSPSEVHQFSHALRSTFTSLEQLPIPTIAVVEGIALGGGLELALSCDLRICSECSLLGMPETGLAIMPGAGGTQRLPRTVGVSRAKDLIFTGRKIDGKEALSMGLVNYCVPPGEAYSKALEVAKIIVNEKGPIGIRMAKDSINRGSEVDMDAALAIEGQCYDRLIYTQDRIEALDAFIEKRKPKYFGR